MKIQFPTITNLEGIVATGFLKVAATTGALSVDTSTYLTSLSGAVLTDQTSGQTIGDTTNRLTKLWATDITVSNAITGSITGNAGTVTNGIYTTSQVTALAAVTSAGDKGKYLFNNASTGALEWATAAGGAVEGTAVLSTGEAGGTKFLREDGDGTCSWQPVPAAGANTALSNLASVAINTTLVSDTDNTDALGTAAISWSDLFLGDGSVITWSTAPSTADVTLTHSANTLTLAGGDLILSSASLGATGTRVTKGWFTDLEVTNAIAGSVTGNAGTASAVAVGGITGLGTGVATALAINVASAGAFVTFDGALGTPSSGTVTNLTGTASININGTVGATTPSTVVATTVTTNTGLMPDVNDGAYLGQAGTAFSDLFLASGAVINFDSGNATITHSAGLISLNVPLSVGTGFRIGGVAGAGKILVGDGTNFVASTPTFPNASATSGKIIKSDGTNWLASTETYPAPGTSGNYMKSDGTNWTSAAGPAAAVNELSVWVGPGCGVLTGTGASFARDGDGDVSTIAFTDNNSGQEWSTNFRVPAAAAGKSISSIQIIYRNMAASALNIYCTFKVYRFPYSNGGAMETDNNGGFSTSASPAGTSKTGIITAAAACYNAISACAAGDVLAILFRRDGANGSDTYGQTLYILGMMVTFA